MVAAAAMDVRTSWLGAAHSTKHDCKLQWNKQNGVRNCHLSSDLKSFSASSSDPKHCAMISKFQRVAGYRNSFLSPKMWCAWPWRIHFSSGGHASTLPTARLVPALPSTRRPSGRWPLTQRHILLHHLQPACWWSLPPSWERESVWGKLGKIGGGKLCLSRIWEEGNETMTCGIN